MITTSKNNCSGKIWGAYRDVSGRVYACSRNATVKRDGQWYCWQHDPERQEADKKKRRAADDAKWDRRSAMYARRARDAKLAELVTPELAELLEQLAGMAVLIASETEARYGIDDSLAMKQSHWVDEARALAARIRQESPVPERKEKDE